MQQEIEYLIRLSDTERYRHSHVKIRGEILFFRVQFETLFRGQWRPVVRYDTAHGFAHRDVLDFKGRIIDKTPLFNQDFNSALAFAENDLKLNWPHYKERFMEGI